MISAATDDNELQLLNQLYDKLILHPQEVNYVIYHNDCVDGYTARVIASQLLVNDETCVYYGASYNNKQPPWNELNGKNVLIVDFSYPDNDMKQIMKVANKVCVLDHHKTAYENLQNVPETNKIVLMNHSGAFLAWFYFNRVTIKSLQNDVPLFVQYVEDRDIWNNALPETEAASVAIANLPFSVDRYIKYIHEHRNNGNVEFIRLREEGIALLAYKKNIINNSLRNSGLYLARLKANNQYYIVNTLNSNVFKSDLGNILVMQYPFVDFSIIYDYNAKNDKTQFSLRSAINREDVSVIAQLHGSGGHAAASGHSMEGLHRMLPYTELYILDPIFVSQIHEQVVNDNKSNISSNNIVAQILIQHFMYPNTANKIK